MNITQLTFIPAILSLLVLPACGGKKSKKREIPSPAAKVEYFVHGDPLTLIQGSVQNKTTFLKVEELDRFNNFSLAGFISFVERSKKEDPKTWDDVEDENSTESEEAAIRKAFALNNYRFTEVKKGIWNYQDSTGDSVKLSFAEKDGHLHLTSFGGYPVQVQHYSVKADGSAFSVLFTIHAQEMGQALVSLSFSSNADEQPLEFAPEGYSYLFGSARIAWKEPMKLQACGQFNELEKASIQASMDAWFKDEVVAVSSRPVAFSFTETYAPFSDLNQQCIRLIKNFKAESSTDFYIAGLAAPAVSAASKSLIDSDIFIFMDHTPVRLQLSASNSETLIHEIGHYLGLGHEFRKDDKDQALHPSIMGYSQGLDAISPWDFEAVRKLYGAPLAPATQP